MKALWMVGIAAATFAVAAPTMAQTNTQATVPGAVRAVPDTSKGDSAGYTGTTAGGTPSVRPSTDAATGSGALPSAGTSSDRGGSAVGTAAINGAGPATGNTTGRATGNTASEREGQATPGAPGSTNNVSPAAK